jgi:hypothetical protein
MALQQMNKETIGNDNTENTWNDDDIMGEGLLYLRPVSIPILCVLLQDALFRAQGQLGANLILGGVWKGRAYLRAIHPHGSMDVQLPFSALGSGGFAAMSLLEQGYSNDLTLEEGIALVQRAILAGIKNDLGSGSQVDICIIRPDGSSQHIRCAVPEEALEDVEIFSHNKSMPHDQSYGEENNVPSVGVNGFGNQPFAIQSARQRVVSYERNEERRKQKWDKALGFSLSIDNAT